jgi:GDP-L-fucose synthase
MDLTNKIIIVTGGAGFLGSHVVDILHAKGCNPDNIIIPRSENCDLTKECDVSNLFEAVDPDIVIHMAATVGGIGINREKPGTFYYKNLMMGTLLIEHAKRHGIEKFVTIGTICAYPNLTPIPFKEEDLWNGYPETTNAPYGIAKKALLVQSQAYRDEFNFNGIYLLPVNLYGPRDNFSPKSSHVIPALIKKCLDANDNKEDIVVWGTGNATREFIYVKDAAEAIVLATEKYDKSGPINVGSGMEISIKNLVNLIAELTEFKGSIQWDDSYPDGQPRRMLDTTKALAEFGFAANTDFEEGLKRTIEWYQKIVKWETEQHDG